MQNIRVLIIDEHEAVRRLLARRLDGLSGFSVVAQTSNPLEGTELAHKLKPDVILADLKRRGAYSLEMYKRIARASPRSRMAIFTSYLDADEKEAYLRAGIDLCLLKDIGLAELAGAISTLVDGKGSPSATRRGGA